MSETTYIRCTNPKCHKLNPIQSSESEKAKEHTCVFCGSIITPQRATEVDDNASSKKKDHNNRFPRQRSENRPVNRNTRKPLF
ncbi:MAG: hypothetical protein NTV15_00980 [Candidatus Bathyarchaeota archaeon]|nr:hypothetical protein [Candidatus Bathyarchaeota archaeon]